MTAAATKPVETHLHLAGELLTPLPEGALWWAAERVLVVSDLHFEKGSAYAARGQMLPPYDTGATLSLAALAADGSLVEACRSARGSGSTDCGSSEFIRVTPSLKGLHAQILAHTHTPY